jgi:hypothetical protein
MSSAPEPFYSAFRFRLEQTLDWLKSLPPGIQRDRLVEESVSRVFKDEHFQLLEGLRPGLGPQIAGQKTRLCGVNVEKMQDFARSLPPGPEREAAWMVIGERAKDLIEVEPGPDRDAMLRAMVRARGGDRTLEEKIDLVSEISDPEKRRDAFDDLAFIIERTREDSENRQMEKLLAMPGVPEDWKQLWISR